MKVRLLCLVTLIPLTLVGIASYPASHLPSYTNHILYLLMSEQFDTVNSVSFTWKRTISLSSNQQAKSVQKSSCCQEVCIRVFVKKLPSEIGFFLKKKPLFKKILHRTATLLVQSLCQVVCHSVNVTILLRT